MPDTWMILMGVGAVLTATGAIFLTGKREAPEQVNERLRAEVDQLDIKWAEACDADLAAVVARIRVGDTTAQLRDWKVGVAPRSADERRQLVPGLHSIVEFRNMRRRQARQVAEDIVADEHAKAEEIRQARERDALEREWAAAQAREKERERRVSTPQPLPATAGQDGIVLGLRIKDGSEFKVPLAKLQHMLVVGATGAGKSVFVHQLVWQLVNTAPGVESVIIIDLKGGVEFSRYRANPKTRLVWEFSEVAQVMREINDLMERREAVMRERNLRNWPGDRVFVVIDEYAEIQSEVDSAQSREEKAVAQGVVRNLVRIGRRARALGIVMVCSLQKATTDAMDSALRANLNCRVCLRVNSRQFAASVLDGLDDLPADPVTLKPGRFVWYDANGGGLEYAVAEIAPGVSLGSDD